MRIFVFAAIFVWLVVLSQTAAAQDLIGSEVPAGSLPVDLSNEQSLSSRYRLVEVNPGVTADRRFDLHLFDDTRLTATMSRVESHGAVRSWVGRVDGSAGSSVIISAHPSGILAGRIELDGRSFAIIHKSDGVHVIIEVDPASLPSEGENDGVEDESTDLDGDGGVEPRDGDSQTGKQTGIQTNPSVCLPSSTCSAQVLTVLVAYTQDAEDAMGGEASTQTWIAGAITELNTVASNTGLAHSFELGLARKVNYTESGSASTDLNNLRYADGLMDEIHVWRDSVGADLVHLVLDGGGCGIGNLTSDPAEYSSVRSYSTSDDNCFRFNKTFPHELGHNLGLRHDRFVDPGTSPCGWAHGYVNQEAFGGSSNQRWRTVMAYNNQCADAGFNCGREAYFSDPSNTLTGDPMGIAIGETDEADSAYLLERSMCVASDYRHAPPDTVVVATFQESYLGYTGALDTWIASDAPFSSFGSDDELRSDGLPDYAALLYWDVTSIPAGATIVGASIALSITDLSSSEYELYEVKKDWNEVSTTWLESESGVSWQSAGAQGAEDRGSTSLGLARSPFSGVLSVDLNSNGIELVQSWIDGVTPNRGVIVQDYGPSDGLYFHSKDAAETGRHPRLTIWFAPPPTVDSTTLTASVLLQGAWNGSEMNTSLAPHLPTVQPFSGPPWGYAGDESVPADDVGGVVGVPDHFEANPSIVDWVLVDLREGTPPGGLSIAAQRAGFVHADGSISDVDGTSELAFIGLPAAGYYVVVEHRNHAAVMSSSAVDFSSGSASFDFSSSMAAGYQSFSDPMTELAPDKFGLFAADINVDKQVTAPDFNTWLASTKAAETGYVDADVNLDGQVTATDFNLWLTNTKAAAASQVPD